LVEGDSVPGVFLPRLVQLSKQGRPIEQAAHDAEAGG
jgi:hypothetical protein